MSKIGLVTFGDGSKRWRAAARRLAVQGRKSGYFSFVNVITLSKIEKKLTLEDKKFIQANPFGLGYFLFKPIVILHFLEENPEADVVVYLDAGSEIDSSPRKKSIFDQYLAEVEEFGHLGFQLDNVEEQYTKADLASLLNSRTIDSQSGQIGATHLMFLRDFAKTHCANWLETMRKDNYHYLDDSPSLLPNAPGFVSHRHDQSISSLLLKKTSQPNFRSASETEPLPGEIAHQHALGPFVAARNSSSVSRLKDNLGKKMLRYLTKSYYDFLDTSRPEIPFSK